MNENFAHKIQVIKTFPQRSRTVIYEFNSGNFCASHR